MTPPDSRSPARVLVVDDDDEMRSVLDAELTSRGFEVETASNADEAFTRLTQTDFAVVLTDVRMRGQSGLALCERVVGARPDVPVVVMTAFGSMEAAVATLRAGAFDFLTKPFAPEALALALDRAVAHRALREEVRRLRRQVEAAEARTDELLGESRPMVELRDLVRRVAETDTTVLITGESGTGKEIVARSIHAASGRAAGPLVAVNCAAMPEGLLESELFGHARGAFTDAKTARRGLFVDANGGTLFLDEIGEMPLGMQAKLLRALETRSVRPVGGSQEVPFDARLVAATNRDLEEAVRARTFREDLYYRIHVVHVEVPPLRVRGNDVLLLAHHFLRSCADRQKKKVTSIAPATAERLLAYDWPGNVRELHNCIERSVALARFEHISIDDLPPRVRMHVGHPPVTDDDTPTDLVTLEEVETRHVRRVMAAAGNNKKLVARILGIDRATLYRKLERIGLHDRKG